MRSNDITNREEARNRMQQAIRENDAEGFSAAFNQLIEGIGQDIRAEYDEQLNDLRRDMDSRALAGRGVRQLTTEEKTYYQKLSEALRSNSPKQALENANLILPSTVVDAVFDELQSAHPLLSRINFIPTGGAAKLVINVNGYQEAVWGQLCDEVVKEITAGFQVIDTTLLKLSAFLPVCKAMLELGPEWLDAYVRQVLYEAISNGLEAGIVDGSGNAEPIGMTRQVGPGVTVTGGVYPRKAAIEVNDLSPTTVGSLISLLAVDPSGKPRQVRDVLLVVNTQDYFQKVMPATTLLAPDGTYRNDVMPYPMAVLPTAALNRGEAVLGIGYRYFAAAGTPTEGRIEYSDHYRFLEDERVYLAKVFANGMPMDNNAFLLLDISGLQPAAWRAEMVEPAEPSANANLAGLSLGAVSISPAFAAATVTYAATTTNATNTVTAIPAEAGQQIEVLVNDVEIGNGSAAVWNTGSNTVEVNITAADGTTTKTYTVTVTKS